uniref:Ankyrin repeat family A protein 2-like n=1 Tax=Actinia tenebrosa TaxID=6105 RepID=A0A6P8HU69_ACTTE
MCSMSVLLGSQYLTLDIPESKYSKQIEPDQEVAAVLCSGLEAENSQAAQLKPPQTPLLTPKSEQEQTESCSTNRGSTAAQYPSLHFLAAQGEAAKIKEEIDKGANINAVDKTGLTPLAWAAAHRQKATVTLLLQNGADATICSPSGESALAFGTCQGQLDVVEQLLEYGADPNVCTLDGGSPLMFAAYNGYPQMVKVLLEHGADLTATNDEGHTAFSLAVGMGNKNVQRVIDDYLRSILENPRPQKLKTEGQ